jgi:hypothetical protein
MSNEQSPEEKEQARQKQQRIVRRSTILSLVGGILFGGLGYLVYKTTPSPYEEQKQSVILHTDPTVSMNILQQTLEGGWGNLDHQPNWGERVAFNISTTHPIHVALFAETNHANKHLEFDYLRVPPGENRLLKINNRPYVYEVKEGDEHVVFCMVISTEAEKLPQTLATVLPQLHLDDLPKEHCASW